MFETTTANIIVYLLIIVNSLKYDTFDSGVSEYVMSLLHYSQNQYSPGTISSNQIHLNWSSATKKI